MVRTSSACTRGLCVEYTDGCKPHVSAGHDVIIIIYKYIYIFLLTWKAKKKNRHVVQTVALIHQTHTHTYIHTAHTRTQIPSCSDVGQSSLGGSGPQYSTVTTLVLRYSKRASSPVDRTVKTMNTSTIQGFLFVRFSLIVSECCQNVEILSH